MRTRLEVFQRLASRFRGTTNRVGMTKETPSSGPLIRSWGYVSPKSLPQFYRLRRCPQQPCGPGGLWSARQPAGTQWPGAGVCCQGGVGHQLSHCRAQKGTSKNCRTLILAKLAGSCKPLSQLALSGWEGISHQRRDDSPPLWPGGGTLGLRMLGCSPVSAPWPTTLRPPWTPRRIPKPSPTG